MVSVRSLNWIQLSFLDGTVVRTTDEKIEIPEGVHRVKWETAKKTGEKTLDVKQDQHLVLGDSDFN